MRDYFDHRLFISKMVNNYKGSIEQGLNMVHAFAEFAQIFSFQSAFKLQFRNQDTFMNPDSRSNDKASWKAYIYLLNDEKAVCRLYIQLH